MDKITLLSTRITQKQPNTLTFNAIIVYSLPPPSLVDRTKKMFFTKLPRIVLKFGKYIKQLRRLNK